MPTQTRSRTKATTEKTKRTRSAEDDDTLTRRGQDEEPVEEEVTDDLDDVDDIAVDEGGSAVEKQNAQLKRERAEKSQEEIEAEIEKARDELSALDPWNEPRRWVIGKGPEQGGKEDQYMVLVQEKMPWMRRAQFFSLVAKTFSTAIKASGGNVGGLSDVFGDEEGGSLIERGRRLTQRDFSDATQFMALAMELVGYSPDFLVNCYCIWLDVPRRDRGWAMARFREEWAPEKDRYGLKDEDHTELIQTFIDQNYEAIRDFFVEELPAIGKRAALHEKAGGKDRKERKGRKSK